MKKKCLFIDAETDGLYGSLITTAMMVTDEEGAELDRFYCGVRIRDEDTYQDWVREHVLPYLGSYEVCETEEILLERIWAFWEKWKQEVWVVADIPYPVEAAVFVKCVRRDPEHRQFEAPYPILDLGTILWTHGLDPLTERDSLLEGKREGMIHNAWSDVLTMIEIWKTYGRR